GARDHFVLTGDIHHYERSTRGRLLHVIAGGGGAFLHPTRLAKGGLSSDRVWPEAAQCRPLLRGVPFKVALGRSGVLPHLLLTALFAPAVTFGSRAWERHHLIVSAPIAVTLVLTTILALIGGVRRRLSVLPYALVAAVSVAFFPLVFSFGIGLL